MKTTVNVYPRLLFLCLCVPVSADIGICRIKTVYYTHVMARMAARLNHDDCRTLQRREGLELRYRSAFTVICGVQLQ